MRTFWEKGYRHASLEDLLSSASIKRQSLYGAFGDKREIFLKALRRYSSQTLEAMKQELDGGDSPLKAIGRFIRHAAELPRGKNCPAGCLMANSVLELGLEDDEVAKEARGLFGGMEKLLSEVLAEGQRRGEVTLRFSNYAIARGLLNTLNGIRILEKAKASKRDIHEVVELSLALIKA